MLSKKKLSVSSLCIMALSVVIFSVIGYFNYLYPNTSDDWLFSLNSHDDIISSFSDIIQATQIYYLSWGGRVLVHIVSRTILWMGDPFPDIINAMFFVLLILLIYKISNYGKKVIGCCFGSFF